MTRDEHLAEVLTMTAQLFAPPTPAERRLRDRKRAIEAVVDAYRDYADTLDWDDLEDFQEDCRHAIGEAEPTERQKKFAQIDWDDMHPRRPT
jgi:hypothetical protein